MGDDRYAPAKSRLTGSQAHDSTTAPISMAIVNDYRVVVAGVRSLLEAHSDRIVVAELDLNVSPARPVDIALYDTFADAEPDFSGLRDLTERTSVGRVVVYTWSFHAELIRAALAVGVDGYLSKKLSGEELVAALEAVHRGERVVTEPSSRRHAANDALDWPGRSAGLTEREAEIMALITQGHANAEIVRLLHLSINTIKSHIRTAYRKIGVSNRVEAVLWGLHNGMAPEHRRVELDAEAG